MYAQKYVHVDRNLRTALPHYVAVDHPSDDRGGESFSL